MHATRCALDRLWRIETKEDRRIWVTLLVCISYISFVAVIRIMS